MASTTQLSICLEKQRLGRPRLHKPMATIAARCDLRLKQKVDSYAQSKGLSGGQVVRQALYSFLKDSKGAFYGDI